MCKPECDEVLQTYLQLKDRYPVEMTTTGALGQGFTMDCPILVGKAHGQIIELYDDGAMLVLDVMDEAHTKGTHWHPYNADCAAHDIAEFMDGKADYALSPLPKE